VITPHLLSVAENADTHRRDREFGHARRDRARPPAHVRRARGRQLIASGTSTYVEGAVTINGGAVLSHDCGRDAYRALVRTRSEDAVARETPTLVTQAGRMSLPILERLRFREVARIHILVDRFGP